MRGFQLSSSSHFLKTFWENCFIGATLYSINMRFYVFSVYKSVSERDYT